MTSGSNAPRSRVVVRGLGSISALGARREEVVGSYTAGQPRLRRWRGPEAADATSEAAAESVSLGPLPCGPLAETSEHELRAFLAERTRARKLDRSVGLALWAARRAFDEAWSPADRSDVELDSLGVAVGSSRGATGLWEQGYSAFLDSPSTLPPSTSPTTTLGNLASWVAQELGPRAQPITELSSTCSTALSALGVAVAFLRAGMASRFVAGGAEAPLTAFTFAQMTALGVHSRSTDAVPCRPCALERPEPNCMALGEGAAMLALEACPQGQPAPSRSLAWLSGIGFAVEPITSKTSIHRDGLGLRLSMERALADAGGPPPDVVVTHTPGTAQGDQAELTALRAVFGPELPHLVSNKWLLGHCLGASGALSLEYAILLLNGLRPVPYPYATLTCGPAPAVVRRVLVNSIGFGGNAASVVVDRAG